MASILNPEQRRTLLTEAVHVAVLGARATPLKPAFYVPDYLHQMGYAIYPVNATRVGETLWGQPVLASLAELGRPIDIVNVFRPPEALAGHLPDLLAMSPRPRAVWLQLGIADADFAAAAVAAGIDVVQDECALANHQTFALRPKGQGGPA